MLNRVSVMLPIAVAIALPAWHHATSDQRRVPAAAPASRQHAAGQAREIFAPGIVEGRRPEVPLAVEIDGRLRSVDVEELDALQVGAGCPARVSVDGLPAARLPDTVVRCAPAMIPKPRIRNRPGERSDVHVREVLIS
jgi:hypothetical protein